MIEQLIFANTKHHCMKFKDWSPENDQYLKKKEIEIHDVYHADTASKELSEKDIFNSSRMFRIKSLDYAVKRIGKTKLEGNILEIGAGDGWCSAYILKNHNPKSVHIMEINDSAIQKLIPKVLQTLGQEKKDITLVKGSFNHIPEKETFDYVIAMGAIHHSANLYKTLNQIYESLVPGGWFIAQEPYMTDNTPNSFYYNRNAETANFKGLLKVKNADRSDTFYRSCEYLTAGYHAGFDFQYEEARNSAYTLKKKLRHQVRSLVKKDVKAQAKNMVIFAQKPLNPVSLPTPTAWEY